MEVRIVMESSKFSKQKRRIAAIGLITLCVLFFSTSGFAKDNPTSSDTFEVMVSTDLVDLTKSKPAKFGPGSMDTLPLLEFRDISFLRYDPAKAVEYAFDLMPSVFDRIRPRLPKLYMRSFIILINHKAVYSGILVPNDFTIDYLKKAHYTGPIMLLPPKIFDSNTSNRIKLSYFPLDGIYRRSDDPRGNTEMIDLFKKAGKILF